MPAKLSELQDALELVGGSGVAPSRAAPAIGGMMDAAAKVMRKRLAED